MNPVLYLHGFASGPSSRKARFFREYLEAAGAQVEVLDLARDDFEHLTLTGQLLVVEEAAAGRRVALIGSSMGGYLAALYAARHPETACLVLLAPAFDFARLWRERLGEQQMEQWLGTGWIETFHYALNRPCRLAYGLMEDARRYEPFPDFAQPTLIFHGAQDDVVPLELSERCAAVHPNAQLEVLDSGHEMLNVLEAMGPRTLGFLERFNAAPQTPPLRP